MLDQDILLTTYPGHKSQNVGDNLITESARKLVLSRQPDYSPVVLFRERSLDDRSADSVRSILAPGFSVSNDTYPKLYKLYSNLERLKNFCPVGCSFQHPLPSHQSFDAYVYGNETLEALAFISERCGGLPCRDMLIEKLLKRNGIEARYCGDLALFDQQKIGTVYRGVQEVRSIVFTIQHHHVRFDEQAKVLLKFLCRRFSSCQRYISFHSKPNPASEALVAYAGTLGFEALHMYGGAANLDRYDDVDLHIGYRLHGHITFLRKRKPSVLLIEDARSFGFANSGEFSRGCFDALDLNTLLGYEETPEQIMDYLEQEIKDGFLAYSSVFNMIDDTYTREVAPIFDRFCSLIN